MIDFHTLYKEYAPQVHRFALFLCGDSSLADDITSETFVRAWTARGRIREATVKAYLFTIARNLYRDAQRRNARHVQLEESVVDSGPSLQSRIGQKSELDAVLAALQGLHESDRAALLLRVQEGMSYELIAATLGLTPVAARVKVHRARLRLLRVRTVSQEVRS